MSLLNGPDAVTVTPMARVEDDYGSTVQPGTPVRVDRVTLQAGASREDDGRHVQVDGRFVIFGRGVWPGGPHSRVRVETGPYAGREFDQVAEAMHRYRSPATAHYEVHLTVRAVEVS